MNARERMVFDMAREGLTSWDVDKVLRELPALQRGHVAACNEPDEGLRLRAEARGDGAFAMISSILRRGHNVVAVKRQTDPRGWPVEVECRDGVTFRLGCSR